MSILNKAKESPVLDALQKIAIGLLVFMGQQMYSNMQQLTRSVPVLQEQIKNLQSDNERLKNKVFPMATIPLFAKKEDEITFKTHPQK